jgi:TPR repeat protein
MVCTILGVLGFGTAPAAAQKVAPCSFQYLLQNDPAYWSEASYTLDAVCVRKLRADLKAVPSPTPESRYLELHLARWDGDKTVIAQAFAALCREEGYGKACSAAALLMAEGPKGPEAEAEQLLELAASRQVPAAIISLGDLYLLRFRSSRDSRDLCRACRFWQAASALGDPVGRRRLDWVDSELKPNCTES